MRFERDCIGFGVRLLGFDCGLHTVRQGFLLVSWFFGLHGVLLDYFEGV